MSFILDALKKSEAERQRQSGPTLLELRITQPRRRYPVWAMWVAGLLAVNVAVLLYALLRRTPAVPTAATVATTQAVAGTAAARITAAPATTPAAVPTSAPPPAPAAATAASQAAVSAVAPLASTGTPGPAGVAGPSSSANPADDEPAVPAAPAAPSAPANRYAELPSAASLGGDLPSLQLNLLASSNLATERYALINMHRVREGDILPEGPRVLAITRQGVAMDYHGQQFMLRPSGGASP
jgi:hypothetical protein